MRVVLEVTFRPKRKEWKRKVEFEKEEVAEMSDGGFACVFKAVADLRCFGRCIKVVGASLRASPPSTGKGHLAGHES